MPGARARTATPTCRSRRPPICKKVYFDTVVFTPDQLRRWSNTFGADHVIMGTDYPFDMLEFDPIGHINSVDSFDETHARRARRRQRQEDAGDVSAKSLAGSDGGDGGDWDSTTHSDGSAF